MASTLQTAPAPPIDALDFLRLGDGLSDEERLIRDNVRAFVREQLIPKVREWFEQGELPRELAGQLGALGVLGMHLEGYGCAGASATVVRDRLPGARGRRLGPALVRLGPGLAGDVRDLALRLGGAEAGLAAADGRRRGDRLLRPDRARCRLRPRRDAHHRQARGRRLGAQRHEDVDHERLARGRGGRLGAHRRRASAASSSRATRPASRRRTSTRRCRCARR